MSEAVRVNLIQAQLMALGVEVLPSPGVVRFRKAQHSSLHAASSGWRSNTPSPWARSATQSPDTHSQQTLGDIVPSARTYRSAGRTIQPRGYQPARDFTLGRHFSMSILTMKTTHDWWQLLKSGDARLRLLSKLQTLSTMSGLATARTYALAYGSALGPSSVHMQSW